MNPEYRPVGGGPLREAHKINYLVDQGKISSIEAFEASRQEIDNMIETMFDDQYTQHFWAPWEMREKSMGQKAEDLLVELLNLFPWIHARHATDREDYVQKIDLAVKIGDIDREIPIQLATFTDPEKLDEKRKKIPPTVLLVAVPMADIFIASEHNDYQRLKRILKEFARQVLAGIRSLPDYLPVYRDLQTQLAKAAA